MFRPLRFSIASLVTILCLATRADAGANQIVNGDAETGDLTGWTDALGQGYSINATIPFEGLYSFHGGLGGPMGTWMNEIHQDVDVSADSTDIDAGMLTATFQAAARTNTDGVNFDFARVIVEFRNAAGTPILNYDSGEVSPGNTWVPLQDVRMVPVGTRAIRVRLLSRRGVGSSTDGFHDAVSLELDAVTSVSDGARRTWGQIKGGYRL